MGQQNSTCLLKKSYSRFQLDSFLYISKGVGMREGIVGDVQIV
jgi:hypothetical protein